MKREWRKGCNWKGRTGARFTENYIQTNALIIQGVSRLEDITAGGDFLGLCDQKISYKLVSDFGRLRSYDRLKEGNDY